MYPRLGTFIIPIHTYGLLLSIGFLSGIISGIYHGKKMGITTGNILDLAVWVIISAIAGSRVFYILLYPDQFPTVTSWFELQKGGLVFFGGFIATTFTVVGFSRYKKIPLANLGDLIAPSLGIALALGRVGCFLNGCCYGSPTASPFGVVFPVLKDNAPRHPTQLYEATFSFLATLLASWLSRHREKFFPGFSWGVYVLAYSTFRFFNEILRADDRGGFFTSLQLSISQCISIAAFVASLGWLAYCYRFRTAAVEKVGESEQSLGENVS